MSLSYNYPPQMAYPSAPPAYRAFPAPPRLHWAWVLVLSVLTVGIFWRIWLVVQGWWVKKATGNTRAFAWALAYVIHIPAILLLMESGRSFFTLTHRAYVLSDFSSRVTDLSRVLEFLLYVASVFMLRSALESQPIRIPLHGLATFFFGPVYFQYYLRKYSVHGKAGEQLSGFGDSAGHA